MANQNKICCINIMKYKLNVKFYIDQSIDYFRRIGVIQAYKIIVV